MTITRNIGRDLFDIHSLYTMGNFFQARMKHIIWTKIVMWIGIIIEVLSILVVSAGIISLLPPDGNLLHFWTWLPSIAKGAIPVIIAAVSVAIAFRFAISDFTSWKESWEFFPLALLLSAILVLGTCTVPMAWFYLFLINDDHKTIEKMVSLKKIILIAPLYALGGSLLTAVFGFLVIRHWPINNISPYLGIACLTIITLLGIFLEERSSAFGSNTLASWLESHPRGTEIFDEFARGTNR